MHGVRVRVEPGGGDERDALLQIEIDEVRWLGELRRRSDDEGRQLVARQIQDPSWDTRVHRPPRLSPRHELGRDVPQVVRPRAGALEELRELGVEAAVRELVQARSASGQQAISHALQVVPHEAPVHGEARDRFAHGGDLVLGHAPRAQEGRRIPGQLIPCVGDEARIGQGLL